ncbi:Intradiol ring-cleavage dioxygenase, partial [Xylaria sp. FL0043]
RIGLDWLEACGQICTKDRKELITVSDIFGLSTLVDEIDHPKPPGATEGSILGPVHSLEADNKMNGDHISSDPNGEPLFVHCTVKDTNGNLIPGARVHVSEADSHGQYDIENADRTGPDGRGVLHTNENGEFYFNAITPVPYPILCDGPVGTFFNITGRHQYRPARIHFMFEKEGFDKLITALYLRDSEYRDSDAVFGVKSVRCE